MHFFLLFLRGNVPVTPHLLGFSSGSVIHHFFRTNAIWKSDRNYPLKCYRGPPPPAPPSGDSTLIRQPATAPLSAARTLSWERAMDGS